MASYVLPCTGKQTVDSHADGCFIRPLSARPWMSDRQMALFVKRPYGIVCSPCDTMFAKLTLWRAYSGKELSVT